MEMGGVNFSALRRTVIPEGSESDSRLTMLGWTPTTVVDDKPGEYVAVRWVDRLLRVVVYSKKSSGGAGSLPPQPFISEEILRPQRRKLWRRSMDDGY